MPLTDVEISKKVDSVKRVNEQLKATFCELKDLQGSVKDEIEKNFDDERITDELERGLSRLQVNGNDFSKIFNNSKEKETGWGCEFRGAGFTLTLQVALKKLGYDVGGIDGIYGENTKKAVRKFQGDNKGQGLVVDGAAGVNTLTVMLKKIKGLTREPKQETKKTPTYSEKSTPNNEIAYEDEKNPIGNTLDDTEIKLDFVVDLDPFKEKQKSFFDNVKIKPSDKNNNKAKAGAEVGGSKGKVESKKGNEFPYKIQSILNVFLKANDEFLGNINYTKKPRDEKILDFEKMNISKSQIESIIDIVASNQKYVKNLESLNIFGCDLSSLPSNISKLTNLTYLDISANEITSIPKDICKLTKLNDFLIDLEKINTFTIPSKCTVLDGMSFSELNPKNYIIKDNKDGTKTYTKKTTK